MARQREVEAGIMYKMSGNLIAGLRWELKYLEEDFNLVKSFTARQAIIEARKELMLRIDEQESYYINQSCDLPVKP